MMHLFWLGLAAAVGGFLGGYVTTWLLLAHHRRRWR